MFSKNNIKSIFRTGTRIGVYLGVDDARRPTVSIDNSEIPIVAFLVSSCLNESEYTAGDNVLLWIDEEQSSPPIIIGFIHKTFIKNSKPTFLQKSEFHPTLTVDGKSINLEAKKEVVLKCGHSSITLDQSGKILIKGKNIISRSSGTNSIKGSNVNIN